MPFSPIEVKPHILLSRDSRDVFLPASAICAADGRGLIFDADVFAVSTDDRMRAIIGHELGHVRSYCDTWADDHLPLCNGPGCDECEDRAEFYTTKWNLPLAHEDLYQTDGSRQLNALAVRLGLASKFFRVDTAWGFSTFMYVLPGERIGLFGTDPGRWLERGLAAARRQIRSLTADFCEMEIRGTTY